MESSCTWTSTRIDGLYSYCLRYTDIVGSPKSTESHAVTGLECTLEQLSICTGMMD